MSHSPLLFKFPLEKIVCSVEFFHFLFGNTPEFVAEVAHLVRVIFHAELAIGFFDGVHVGSLVKTQAGIISCRRFIGFCRAPLSLITIFGLDGPAVIFGYFQEYGDPSGRRKFVFGNGILGVNDLVDQFQQDQARFVGKGTPEFLQERLDGFRLTGRFLDQGLDPVHLGLVIAKIQLEKPLDCLDFVP